MIITAARLANHRETGVGAGLLGPAQQAAVADVIGRERSGGRVLAAYQMTADIGAILGPVVSGLLLEHDLSGVFIASMLGGLVVRAGAIVVLERQLDPVENGVIAR